MRKGFLALAGWVCLSVFPAQAQVTPQKIAAFNTAANSGDVAALKTAASAIIDGAIADPADARADRFVFEAAKTLCVKAGCEKTEAAKNLKLSLADIIEYRKLHPRMPAEKAAMLMTQFHGRIAQPWTCVVVVLMALPFGAMTGKRNVFTGVAGSVGICFFYFVLLRWGLALGTSGHIPPVVAAWLPNVVFAGMGLGVLLKLR